MAGGVGQEAMQADEALAAADEAYGRGDVDAVVAHLSRAIRAYTASGDRRRAARACVRLGESYIWSLGNLVAGRAWFARARRLLEDEPPCVEQGWVAIASLGCDVDDPAELLAAAELALDRARHFGDVDLETKALADAGLARVQQGQVTEGMALLDEAMALACGPADDVDAAGKSVCSFFTACYYAADFARAGSWATVLRRRGLIGDLPGTQLFLSSHCDSVQASLLVELGRWTEAEEVLVNAKTMFERRMPGRSLHPDIALADLRIRQGRYAEAEALLLGREHFVQALLPSARLHLARGDAALARAAARRGIRAMADDRLRAVELLTVLVEAELLAGDVGAAAAACADMTERLGDLDVPGLRGRVALARSHVLRASLEPAAALEVAEEALDGVSADELPWLHALLLVEVARARCDAGDETAARVDAAAAAALLAGLDVTVRPDDAEFLTRLTTPSGPAAVEIRLTRDGRWWTIATPSTSARLADTKGLRYLAELVAAPGVERHALDLVDRVEGVGEEATVDRRALGDAGPLLDSRARAAYRHRIEELRAAADDALADGQLERAEAIGAELDALVQQLAAAFGLGGRERKAASAVERARLNVTRAIRSAVTAVSGALPDVGAALDRQVRTGTYCRYDPDPAAPVHWIVQSRLNGRRGG